MTNKISENKIIDKARLEYEQALVAGTLYSGPKKSNEKIFSVSSLGKDLLYNYYDYMYGKKPDTSFGHNTMGSLYQLGIDKTLKTSHKYHSAVRMTYKLPNGWTISGEMDQVDTVNKVIFDNKFIGTSTIVSIKKKGPEHPYAKQLASYQMLMFKNHNVEYLADLSIANKSSNVFKPSSGKPLLWLNMELPSIEDIEKQFIDRTDKLQKFIDLELVPDRCESIMWGKLNGRSIPTTCTFYCPHSNICKHFSSNRTFDKMFLDSL